MDIEHIFRKDGPLARYWPSYKPRPGQIALAKAVESALGDDRHLLAEGPCGTGKSLAYGIPAAIQVLKNGVSVVIATANIALQEQLFKKDLPFIARLMRDIELGDLNFYLRKGFGNYLCLAKLEDQILETKEAWLKKLRRWVEENNKGDKEELPVDYHTKWSLLAADKDDCPESECKFFDECYAFRSQQWSDNRPCIVVTNYHLLYANHIVRTVTDGYKSLLPHYGITVADEAHEMVDIARGFQGFDISMNTIWWLITKMTKRVKHPGTADATTELRENCRDFFERLVDYYQTHKGTLSEPLGFGEEVLESLKKCRDLTAKASAVAKNGEEEALLDKLYRYISKRKGELRRVCYGTPVEVDLRGCAVEENEEDFTNIQPTVLDDDSVYYIEYAGRGQPVHLCSKVIEVQQFIRESVLTPTTLIATSATLSTNNNFDFIAKELGLEADEHASLIAPSPFDPKNMLVVVPSDFPVPQNREQHLKEVSKSIELIVSELGGRSMALFTSYSSLEHVSDYLSTKLPGIDLLVQGKLPRGKIVEGLRNNEKSLILATASFWQGIDIPGRALSCLFIEKFPFAPPTDPIVSYMERKWTARTGDKFSSFMHYSVPKAVISLKQGVGRLIRQETDYGVVVLFDNRIETKNYGIHFESAFPHNHFRSENLSSVTKFIKEQDARAANESSKRVQE